MTEFFVLPLIPHSQVKGGFAICIGPSGAHSESVLYVLEVRKGRKKVAKVILVAKVAKVS